MVGGALVAPHFRNSRLVQFSSASRFTAGAAGFLILNQCARDSAPIDRATVIILNCAAACFAALQDTQTKP
jgi:hypothetical protein